MLWFLVACQSPDAPVERDDPSDRVSALLSEMTLEEKVAQMSGLPEFPADRVWRTPENTRLGIPAFGMVDGPRGVTAGVGTTFPVGMARGATFNPALERAVGEAIGREAAQVGANVLLAPVVEVLRHPRWGRAQETYGEDPHHLGVLGLAFVEGAQEHVLASAKHFAVNSIEDTRYEVSVEVDERTLREVYLPPFRRLVMEGEIASIMTAYNKMNGVYCAENASLLQILKEDWGFTGFVESDWVWGTRSTVASAQAGLDIEMPSPKYYGDALVAAVEAGEVSEDVIDAAVTRILTQKFRFGLDVAEAPDVVDASHLALEVARESLVLLKNAEAVPLEDDSITLIGALSARANLGDTGSSATVPPYAITPLDGLSARTQLTSIPRDVLTESERASLQTAVVVVGLTADDEGELLVASSAGDREGLRLSEAHEALIADVAQHAETTIVVVEGGSAITMPWAESVDAILMAWYPGQEGGTAIAEVLLGEVAPSGRLPLSIPVTEEDLPPFDNTSLSVTYDRFHGYQHLDRSQIVPQFPFGFGLSTTAFSYDRVAVAPDGERATVSVTLTNTGTRRGAEVVQVYGSAPEGPVPQPVWQLLGFEKVWLDPGEVTEVSVTVNRADLDRWEEGWVRDPGSVTLWVGPNVGYLPLMATWD